jgi:hypothetical protein
MARGGLKRMSSSSRVQRRAGSGSTRPPERGLQSLHRCAASQFLGHWQGTLGRQPTDEALAALRRARAAVALIAGGCFTRAGATARSQEGSNGAHDSRSACSPCVFRPTADVSGPGPRLYTIMHFRHPSPVPIQRQEPEQHSASLWHGLPSSRQLPSPRGTRRAHPPSAYRSAARPSRPTSNTGRHQDGMFTPLEAGAKVRWSDQARVK